MYFSNRRGARCRLHNIDWRLFERPGPPEFVSDDCVIQRLGGFDHNCLSYKFRRNQLKCLRFDSIGTIFVIQSALYCLGAMSGHLHTYSHLVAAATPMRYPSHEAGAKSRFAIEMWSKSLSPSTCQAWLPGCVSQYGGIRFRTDILT